MSFGSRKWKNIVSFIYTNREEKAKYTALKYGNFLKGSVLDVGCWNKDLKKYLDNDVEYVGVDVAGKPDVFVDLEKQKIPFPNNAFDCVVCTDVLEHLDNIHETFDELIRLSRKYIIISLPNCYSVNFLKIIKGEGGLKFYGLPIEKPKDRHKWFFNYQEAEEFVTKRAEKNNTKIIEISVPQRKSFKNFILKILLGRKYKNINYPCLWALIKKNN